MRLWGDVWQISFPSCHTEFLQEHTVLGFAQDLSRFSSPLLYFLVPWQGSKRQREQMVSHAYWIPSYTDFSSVTWNSILARLLHITLATNSSACGQWAPKGEFNPFFLKQFTCLWHSYENPLLINKQLAFISHHLQRCFPPNTLFCCSDLLYSSKQEKKNYKTRKQRFLS